MRLNCVLGAQLARVPGGGVGVEIVHGALAKDRRHCGKCSREDGGIIDWQTRTRNRLENHHSKQVTPDWRRVERLPLNWRRARALPLLSCSRICLDSVSLARIQKRWDARVRPAGLKCIGRKLKLRSNHENCGHWRQWTHRIKARQQA